MNGQKVRYSSDYIKKLNKLEEEVGDLQNQACGAMDSISSFFGDPECEEALIVDRVCKRLGDIAIDLINRLVPKEERSKEEYK